MILVLGESQRSDVPFVERSVLAGINLESCPEWRVHHAINRDGSLRDVQGGILRSMIRRVMYTIQVCVVIQYLLLDFGGRLT